MCVIHSLFEEPWWAAHLGRHDCSWWLAAVNAPTLAASNTAARTRLGFVNAAGDLLQHLGANLELYLPMLAALVLRLLQAATCEVRQLYSGISIYTFNYINQTCLS